MEREKINVKKIIWGTKNFFRIFSRRRLNSREEEVEHLAKESVSQERGLVDLADGPEEARLALHPELEEEVLSGLVQ